MGPTEPRRSSGRDADRPSGRTATGLAHAGVTVSDMDRSLGFYADGLGLDCASRRRVDEEYIRRVVQVPEAASIEVAMLAFGGGEIAIELLQYLGGERSPVSTAPCDPGTGHLCVFVEDIRDAWRRALDAGGRPRSPEPVCIESGPYAGGYGAYLSDPDGYTVELLQPPPERTAT